MGQRAVEGAEGHRGSKGPYKRHRTEERTKGWEGTKGHRRGRTHRGCRKP
jgi:hypothetical protein